ncbi:MAG: MarR family transcriptional regulator [bacterium]|nr:MarR family transcriptional regulator [bacterium]
MEIFSPASDKKDAYFAKFSQAFPDTDLKGVEMGSMLFFFANHIINGFTAHFSRYGISQARYGVLLMLYIESEAEWTPADLADAGNISRATMTGLLDGLEKQGYLVRLPRPGDRRSIIIQLSDEGRRFVDEMLPDHFNRLADAMGGLSETERKTLMKIVPRVLQSMSTLVEDLAP